MVSGQIAQDERGELAGPGILRSRRGRYSRTCAGAWQRPGADFGDVVKLAVRPPAAADTDAAGICAGLIEPDGCLGRASSGGVSPLGYGVIFEKF